MILFIYLVENIIKINK